MMLAKYFEYHTIILRGPFFVDTLFLVDWEKGLDCLISE